MKSRAIIKRSRCSLITTHRYLLAMDDKRLDEFDRIIVDEDIIFKSIITNQGEITFSELNQLKQRIDDHRIREKVSELMRQSKTHSCIHSSGFEWTYKDSGIRGVHIDIPSFCAAEYFYYRRANLSDQNPGISLHKHMHLMLCHGYTPDKKRGLAFYHLISIS